MAPFTTLDVSLTGAVLTVRVSNPPTDLLDGEVMADVDELGRRLRRDRRVRAVVLSGPRPGVFIPHYDLAEIVDGAEALGLPTPYPVARAAVALVAGLARLPGAHQALAHTPAAGLVALHRTHATLNRFGTLPQIIIAAIDGDALGGGCEVALACDLRLMGDGDYLFGLPELTAGIPPGAGGSVRLTRALGPARAAAMILTSRTLSPAQALAAGLVSEVVPAGDVAQRAQDWAADLAQRNPAAVIAAKRAIRTASVSVESAGFVSAASGAAAVAALREFVTGADPEHGRTGWRDRSALPRR
ncbi:MAG: enoyl-CoA hydratase [Actinomycetota bacterium]|nr:enoyl-CoA hydratase [Actinomycetota bacterium]